MSGDPFACRCRSFADSKAACATRATQEDMLCDDCRAGCTAAVGLNDGKARHLGGTVEISFRLSPRAAGA